MTEVLEVLNPVATSQGEVTQFSLAPRPKSLDGKKIGLLWNGKRGGETALARVGELLEGRFKNIQLVNIKGSVECTPETLEFAKKECQVAIGSTSD